MFQTNYSLTILVSNFLFPRKCRADLLAELVKRAIQLYKNRPTYNAGDSRLSSYHANNSTVPALLRFPFRRKSQAELLVGLMKKEAIKDKNKKRSLDQRANSEATVRVRVQRVPALQQETNVLAQARFRVTDIIGIFKIVKLRSLFMVPRCRP